MKAAEGKRKLESGARALFKRIDGCANSDSEEANGNVSKMDLATALEENGLMVGDDTLCAIFDELDSENGTVADGKIGETEFVQYILGIRAFSKAEASSQVFLLSVKSFGFWMVRPFQPANDSLCTLCAPPKLNCRLLSAMVSNVRAWPASGQPFVAACYACYSSAHAITA